VRVFIIQVDEPIAPFGEPAREAVIGGLRLADFTDETLARLGLRAERVPSLEAVPEDSGPALLLREDLFVSYRALRSFLQRARPRGGAARLPAAVPVRPGSAHGPCSRCSGSGGSTFRSHETSSPASASSTR